MIQRKTRWTLLLAITLFWSISNVAEGTDSLTRTTTLQTQTILTDNDDGCGGGFGGGGGPCGTISDGGITVQINGGSFNFNLCEAGIAGFSINGNEDRPCRVAPPAIPPGADTQIGTGLNPIVVNDDGFSNVPFGGITNDPVPSGSSNIIFPGLLVHGPSPGETTMSCTTEATCGSNVNQALFRHFQSFRSVPVGQVIDPNFPAVLCTAPAVRCTHIEFSVRHEMTDSGGFGGDDPFVNTYIIDSTTDVNGDIITAGGSFTQTSDDSNGSGTWTIDTTTPGFPGPTAVGFADMVTSGLFGCGGGGGFGGGGTGSVDPFHQNGVTCR